VLILHRYASTEGGVVSMLPIPADDPRTGALPSGFAAPGLDISILDETGTPVADGAAGELVLRGRYLALGEWRDGGLVAGRLRPDPADPARRIFPTGDVFRREPDGMLRFLSRLDRQVKINGVRVEPGEVEAVLRRHPGVSDAAVLAIEHDGAVSLRACVAAPEGDTPTLRAELSRLLADALVPAMRPAQILVLDRLPSLPGGKTDTQALRALADAADTP